MRERIVDQRESGTTGGLISGGGIENERFETVDWFLRKYAIIQPALPVFAAKKDAKVLCGPVYNALVFAGSSPVRVYRISPPEAFVSNATLKLFE